MSTIDMSVINEVFVRQIKLEDDPKDLPKLTPDKYKEFLILAAAAAITRFDENYNRFPEETMDDYLERLPFGAVLTTNSHAARLLKGEKNIDFDSSGRGPIPIPVPPARTPEEALAVLSDTYREIIGKRTVEQVFDQHLRYALTAK